MTKSDAHSSELYLSIWSHSTNIQHLWQPKYSQKSDRPAKVCNNASRLRSPANGPDRAFIKHDSSRFKARTLISVPLLPHNGPNVHDTITRDPTGVTTPKGRLLASSSYKQWFQQTDDHHSRTVKQSPQHQGTFLPSPSFNEQPLLVTAHGRTHRTRRFYVSGMDVDGTTDWVITYMTLVSDEATTTAKLLMVLSEPPNAQKLVTTNADTTNERAVPPPPDHCQREVVETAMLPDTLGQHVPYVELPPQLYTTGVSIGVHSFDLDAYSGLVA